MSNHHDVHTEDWDRMIDQYDRGHRQNSIASRQHLDPEDAHVPPPPPPPPGGRAPARSVSGSPNGSPPPSASPLRAHHAPAGPPPPSAFAHPPGSLPPSALPLTTHQQNSQPNASGIAAAIAARNAMNAAGGAGGTMGRRDSFSSNLGNLLQPKPPMLQTGPQPPPPQQQRQQSAPAQPIQSPTGSSGGGHSRQSSNAPPPIPTAHLRTASSLGPGQHTRGQSGNHMPAPVLVGTPQSAGGGMFSPPVPPTAPTPPPLAAAATNGNKPSLFKVVGAISSGLWDMLSTAASSNPLAPVMQELEATYQPFPDSGTLAAQAGAGGKSNKNLAQIKVVVTAPKLIKKQGQQRQMNGGGPSGLGSGHYATLRSPPSFNAGAMSPLSPPMSTPSTAGYSNTGNDDDDNDGALWEDNQRAVLAESNRSWMRFIEPKSGSVLYLNVHTNAAQGERPQDYDGSDDDEDDMGMDAYLDTRNGRNSMSQSVASPGMHGHGGAGGGFSSPRRARAESLILHTDQGWDPASMTQGQSSVSHSQQQGRRGGPPMSPTSQQAGGGGDPRLKSSLSNSSAGANSSHPTPAGGLARGVTGEEEFMPLSLGSVDNGKSKAPLSIESFLSSSVLYMKQLEQLLEAGQLANAAHAAQQVAGGHALAGAGHSSINVGTHLTEEMEAKLKLLLLSLQDVQKCMDESARNSQYGNEVDSLVLFDKLQWNFSHENHHVNRYRHAVSLIDHRPFEYKMYHLPRYLSSYPLPPDTKAVTIVVKLPDTQNTAAVPVSGESAMAATTRIGVTERDTCQQAIAMAYKKCEGKLVDRTLTINDFVLKGSGIADFMYGDVKIMEYECIRMAVRNGEEVKLSLVRKPQAQPDPEVCQTFIENYYAKLEPQTKTHDPNVVFKEVTSRELKYIPMAELTHLPFRFKLLSLDNINENSLPRIDTISNLYIRIFLFYGCKNVSEQRDSDVISELTSDPRWFQWIVYKDQTLASLPRGTRIGFIVYGRKVTKPEKEVMCAWGVHQLVNDQGYLTTGRIGIKLWSMESRKKGKHGKPREPESTFLHRATTSQNLRDVHVTTLNIQFDEFNLPVVAPVIDKIREPNQKQILPEIPLKNLTKDQTKQWEGLLVCDILKELTPDDQTLLWNMRHHLVKIPGALGKFLQCVNWGKIEDRMETYRLLKIWALPTSPVSALELLDAKFPDPVVREYAINLLRGLKDDELRNYLLQLVQCLKFEAYHDSPLKRFLIERALANPMCIGHYFFWHLKAEVHSPLICERFGLILEEYLSFAGRFTIELKKQANAVLKLQRIAEMVVRLKRDHGYTDPEAMKEYTKEVEKLNKDFFAPQGKFQLPLDPKIEVTTLVVEKCRYMSSKMVPLWLVFRNADPDAPNVYIIFKSGDDLRQDILTLQILTLMDSLWLSAGLDCRMKPYKCIATGVNEHNEGVGLIEVVLNSDTTSGIQLKYGGGAVGALKMDPLDLFLREHNKISKDYERAVDNFVCSCAGYCVATYVLGIGDRHNGNIMVTKDGHLFHIDFGHFLGNFKKKLGFNRERAAFVFTPEMAYVMGGNSYRKSGHFKKFLEYCSRAFLNLRKHANLLENLFGLMVAAGMPELMKESDIYYMRDNLLLNEKESKAEKKLNEEIENSLDSKYRRLDNLIHNLRHG